MKRSEKEFLHEVIDCEGFDYSMVFYSKFKEVKDAKFHDLRDKYIAARKELEEYINK